MNLYILFLVSLPEAILNLYIMLQLARPNNYLNFKDKKNILRYLLALTLMLVSSMVIRPIVPNVMVNLLVHAIAYTVIIYLVYRINMPKLLLCISLILILNSVINNLYIPFIVVYVSKGYENFTRHYELFVLYSIPFRLMQLGIILFLNKYEIMFDMTKIDRKLSRLFTIFMCILATLGLSFSTILYKYFAKMTLYHQIVFFASLFILVFFTVWVVLNLIYFAVKGILIGGYRQYQKLGNDTATAFNEVYDLLKDNDSEGAKRLLEGYLGKNVDKDGGEMK